MLFVRARVDGQSTERQVTLHAFATTEDRTRLRYLPPYQAPSKAADCSIKSTIYFTSYGFANLYPAAKSTRRIEINAQASFAMADLDRYAADRTRPQNHGLHHHLRAAAFHNRLLPVPCGP